MMHAPYLSQLSPPLADFVGSLVIFFDFAFELCNELLELLHVINGIDSLQKTNQASPSGSLRPTTAVRHAWECSSTFTFME